MFVYLVLLFVGFFGSFIVVYLLVCCVSFGFFHVCLFVLLSLVCFRRFF